MMEKTLQESWDELKLYSKEEQMMINKAYQFAKYYHQGQYRESGEEYITHPLTVAKILSQMHADSDTICAGLLHDTLEDTKTTKEEIEKEFNPEIRALVEGVTKISKLNFSSKQEQNFANTRKIITGITEDARIIMIKLADRLHNMRTLEYKKEFKQKENSLETMEIFVPLAYFIGAYRIKNELEDLAFQHLKKDEYLRIEEKRQIMEQESEACLKEMLLKIKGILEDNSIPNEIKVRTKNIYGIYKRLSEGDKLSDIHDLLALKVMVDDVSNCYRTLGLVHQKYHPINDKFKDYICNPKTNRYQSLHSTVFGEEDRLVQVQIRTFDMDVVASFGLSAYWDLKKENVRDVMQKELKEKYQFFHSLVEINKVFGDNKEFVHQIKTELFSDKVYVYTTRGDVIELPKGSTPIDFAYQLHTNFGNNLVGAIVNDQEVELDYHLKTKDRVRLITDEFASGPKEEWLEKVKTTYAKRKIKEYKNK